jgi:type IV secretion system protein VirB1
VDQVFDPCTNLAAGATILAESYHRSGSLNGALSLYNTGRPDSNIGAAYARKVFGQAGVQVPAIPGGKLAELPKAPSFDANPTAMKAVRLTITPSPFAAGAFAREDDFTARELALNRFWARDNDVFLELR